MGTEGRALLVLARIEMRVEARRKRWRAVACAEKISGGLSFSLTKRQTVGYIAGASEGQGLALVLFWSGSIIFSVVSHGLFCASRWRPYEISNQRQ